LKRLSTNEALSEAGELPQDWGPIFGLEGVKDRLGDLSWLGKHYEDMGWVEVEGELPPLPAEATPSEIVWQKAKDLLKDSDWSMISDVPMTVRQKQLWIEYRKALRDIRLQPNFPEVDWPKKPE
tara:strand:+ start:166 stop:537 length:372 start_codon:yes stop_codon:yes gene_type:complete